MRHKDFVRAQIGRKLNRRDGLPCFTARQRDIAQHITAHKPFGGYLALKHDTVCTIKKPNISGTHGLMSVIRHHIYRPEHARDVQTDRIFKQNFGRIHLQTLPSF